jgi:hypothetical protein
MVTFSDVACITFALPIHHPSIQKSKPENHAHPLSLTGISMPFKQQKPGQLFTQTLAFAGNVL